MFFVFELEINSSFFIFIAFFYINIYYKLGISYYIFIKLPYSFQSMQTVSQLQKKIEMLNDEINDIFHATTLNLEALNVQLQSYNESKVTLSTLSHCKREFQNIQDLFKERGQLRLQYLITEQIKEQEAKVRRQRLVEYEEKIYDQRRLISDKETFYQGLLKPRRKRPAHMTIQEFHQMRRQEMNVEERRNLKKLEQDTIELKNIEKMLKNQTNQLENFLAEAQKQNLTQQELSFLQHAIQRNPILYDNLESLPSRSVQKSQIKKIYEGIVGIQKSNQELCKQYMQQKQLNHYLRWQHSKLKSQYLQKQQQKINLEISHIKNIGKMTKYRFKRSCSI